ncbi:MAG: hypothetical protein KAR09_10045, partial [Bacteroidales bacterium]|nr:hypothetical protein [Bacteroidales bacterium]
MARSGVLNVYIEDISPRAGWVFKLVFEDLLGLNLNMTSDSSVLKLSEQPVLNYSTVEASHLLSVTPYGLLSETGLRSQDITMG